MRKQGVEELYYNTYMSALAGNRDSALVLIGICNAMFLLASPQTQLKDALTWNNRLLEALEIYTGERENEI